MKTLRLILGDQLNILHSWFKNVNPDVWYVLMEIRSETDYVVHHIQKVTAIFASMRNFIHQLQKVGHQVIYIPLDDAHNHHSFSGNIQTLIRQYRFERFEYLLPDEYRVDRELAQACQMLAIPTQAFDTEHFLTSRTDLGEIFKGKKTYLLETFYRKMRIEYDLLLEENQQPVGGKWNYDAENRKKYDGKVNVPPPLYFSHDVSQLTQLLAQQNITTLGNIDAQNLTWCLSRKEALALVDYFTEHLLPHFGTYEDAMHTDYPYLFHSRLSFALNIKLINPLEVVQKAIERWQENPKDITLPQIEGFVRQIIGWREYMRGIYWLKMPEYASLNYFNHQRNLPSWFWTGKTHMNCLRDTITNSVQHAFAHHIQRLMITGNFALLAGVHPDEVDKWYLGIYADAFEWVQITNTRGMSQYADGGIVGTKPYVATANYIDKMSNYCNSCFYDKNKKTGQRACPFNSLYWHFYYRHQDKLANNPRIGMMYPTLRRMESNGQLLDILRQAELYLQNIETL